MAEVAPEQPPRYKPVDGDRFTIWDLFTMPDEEDGAYRLAERLAAGRTGRVTLPFPMEFDPADLLPQDE